MSQKKAVARFQKLTLAQQVRMATPMARALVLAVGPDTRLSSEDDVSFKVEQLIGVKVFDGTEDADVQKLMDVIHAGYVFGIAVGLLMRPEMFAGGAR